jgi:hypothetical protein
MTALVVDLERVKRAVGMSHTLGMPETRATVVARIIANTREEQSGDWQQRHERAMRLISATSADDGSA